MTILRPAGSATVEAGSDAIPTEQLSRLFDGPVIVTGGHTLASASRLIENGVADLVGFGRLFMANPDLPERFRTGAPLHRPTTTGFYSGGPEGYVDYPSLADEARWASLRERIRAGHVDPQEAFAVLADRPLPDRLRSGDQYLYTRLNDLLQPAAATR